MVIYRFPPESVEGGSSEQPSNKQPGKTPDFIYVDDVSQHSTRERPTDRESLFANSFIKKGSYPFFLRFLTLLVACILTVWVGVLIVMFTIATLIAAITLFQSPSALHQMAKFWKSIGRFSAYALALYVATLNPAFGFGIFALYALQHGENSKDVPFSSMFQGRF